jgi:putative DNA primase/helicase
MQRALGYSITGDTSEQVLFIAWGLGSNGKSTLFRTIQHILGDYARSVAKDALMKRNGKGDTHPTAIANLVGCRFALLQETEEGRQLDASAIKWVTGGDKITARFLYRDYFEFYPEFKVWLVTNYKPVVADTTYAFWRRLILIPFRAIFDERRRDREMPNKLWAERDGILTWLVQGCLRWQEDGLNPPKVIMEATKEYQTEMDALQQWLEDCCVADPKAETHFADLYASYTEWCKERDETPVSKRKFGERLSEKGYESVLIRDSVLGKPVKARKGVAP